MPETTISYLDPVAIAQGGVVNNAPEDVLGLGSGLPWAMVTLVFVFSLASALAVRPKRFAFALVLLAFFGILSITDLYLYRVLESQVIGS